MYFFFLRVSFSEAGFIHCLTNAPGDNMQKIPFQNSSPFSHSIKMFECNSTQENCEIRNIGQFSPDMVSENWLDFPSHLIFWHEIFLKHYLENWRIKKNTQDFNFTHSWPKEMHRLEEIPNFHWSQWDLSSFTNSKTRHTLGLFKISREPFDIFERGFLRPVSNSCDQIWPGRGHLTLTLGHWGSKGIHGAFLLRLSVDSTGLQQVAEIQWSNCSKRSGPFV